MSVAGYEMHDIITDEVHPSYDNDLVPEYDFRLLRLRTRSSQPYKLKLDDGKTFTILQQQPVMTVLGWGLTECNTFSADLSQEQFCSGSTSRTDLRWGYVSYRDPETCYPQYRYIPLITEPMLCAEDFLGDSNAQDACQGDSGGPLIHHQGEFERMPWGGPGTDVQVGVISWGVGCARSGNPGVYARVSTAYNWIQITMRRMSQMKFGR